MKAKTFKYTKANGSVTERRGIEVAKPTDNYAFLEIPEGVDMDAFIVAAIEMQAERNRILTEFLKNYGSAYKNFKASGISDLKDL